MLVRGKIYFYSFMQIFGNIEIGILFCYVYLCLRVSTRVLTRVLFYFYPISKRSDLWLRSIPYSEDYKRECNAFTLYIDGYFRLEELQIRQRQTKIKMCYKIKPRMHHPWKLFLYTAKRSWSLSKLKPWSINCDFQTFIIGFSGIIFFLIIFYPYYIHNKIDTCILTYETSLPFAK